MNRSRSSFLLTIVAVPLFETVADLRSNFALRQALLAQGVDRRQWPGRRPRSFDVLDLMPSWRDVAAARGDVSKLDRSAARAAAYSTLRGFAGPEFRCRRSLFDRGFNGSDQVRWASGNEKVYIGRDRWLFYSDGVAYVTGPGFLDPEQLARNVVGRIQPDPRPAIRQFHDELKRLGVTLIVFPTPDKVMIRPESFSRALMGRASPRMLSWPTFRSGSGGTGDSGLRCRSESFTERNWREPPVSPHRLALESGRCRCRGTRAG